MSVLKNFENISWSPVRGGGATGVMSRNGRHDLNVIFFEFAKRSLAGGGGPVTPPRATGGLPPYISLGLHSLLI